MNRKTVIKVVVIVAILASVLVAFNMYSGKPATVPAAD